MSDDYKIYVDGGRPATLNNGAGASTDCATLQEAVLAWRRLPPEQKIRATVKVIGGPVYTVKAARLLRGPHPSVAEVNGSCPKKRHVDDPVMLVFPD
jgi:hypothetical protein